MISLFSFGEYKFVSGSIDYHYILYVHCLNIDNEANVIASIKDTFEKKILEVYEP